MCLWSASFTIFSPYNYIISYALEIFHLRLETILNHLNNVVIGRDEELWNKLTDRAEIFATNEPKLQEHFKTKKNLNFIYLELPFEVRQ